MSDEAFFHDINFGFRLCKSHLEYLHQIKPISHEGGGPQVGEVTCVKLPHLTCKRDHIKMRDYLDRRVTPRKRVTSPTWGPPPPCKQALNLFLMTPDEFSTGCTIWPDISFTWDGSIFLLCSHGTLNCQAPEFWYGWGGYVWTEHPNALNFNLSKIRPVPGENAAYE